MTTPSDDFVSDLVGRSLDDATHEATEAGWVVRAVSPGSVITADYRAERINLEHEDGVVTRAWVS